jgi:hypothetical protein
MILWMPKDEKKKKKFSCLGTDFSK